MAQDGEPLRRKHSALQQVSLTEELGSTGTAMTSDQLAKRYRAEVDAMRGAVTVSGGVVASAGRKAAGAGAASASSAGAPPISTASSTGSGSASASNPSDAPLGQGLLASPGASPMTMPPSRGKRSAGAAGVAGVGSPASKAGRKEPGPPGASSGGAVRKSQMAETKLECSEAPLHLRCVIELLHSIRDCGSGLSRNLIDLGTGESAICGNLHSRRFGGVELSAQRVVLDGQRQCCVFVAPVNCNDVTVYGLLRMLRGYPGPSSDGAARKQTRPATRPRADAHCARAAAV